MIRGAQPLRCPPMSDEARASGGPATALEDCLALAASVRPQGFGSTHADQIVEPVVEPAWPGVRVIAATRAGRAILLADGAALDGHAEILARLGSMTAATTTGVILDGYVTKQAVNDEAQIYTGVDDMPSAGQMIVGGLIGVRRDRRAELAKELEAEAEARRFDDEIVNLVLVDVLWLDGDWLLDVPLLERKRQLESIVPGDPLVRAGPYVRPPIATWVGSWRAQGFLGLTFKGANSRYRPGEKATDWATASMPRR